MRIGVIGSGALGLYYGALLQRAGHDVHFLLRRDFEAISQAGLTVTSPSASWVGRGSVAGSVGSVIVCACS